MRNPMVNGIYTEIPFFPSVSAALAAAARWCPAGAAAGDGGGVRGLWGNGGYSRLPPLALWSLGGFPLPAEQRLPGGSGTPGWCFQTQTCPAEPRFCLQLWEEPRGLQEQGAAPRDGVTLSIPPGSASLGLGEHLCFPLA